MCASLDKLEGREQQLTSQFQGLLDSYRESRQQLTDMQEEYSRCGRKVGLLLSLDV